MKKIILIFLLVFIFILSSSCKTKPNYQLLKVELDYSFDTMCSVIVEYDAKSTTKNNTIKEISNLLNPKLHELELMFSGNESNYQGFTKDINKNAGSTNYVTTNKEYINVLNISLEYSKNHPEFNICIGAITSLWDISNHIGVVDSIPSDADINTALNYLDPNQVSINNYDVLINQSNVSLDFGAVAKGYAVDACAKLLEDNGYDFYVLNFGGSVKVKGTSHVDFSTFVGITNPIEETGSIIKVKSNYSSYITSGSNYRYIEYLGHKYSHIINPITGYPVENNLASVTIIGEDALICDILSTMCYVMGLNDGISYINTTDYSAIFITNDKDIYIVGQMEYELLDSNFKINE